MNQYNPPPPCGLLHADLGLHACLLFPTFCHAHLCTRLAEDPRVSSITQLQPQDAGTALLISNVHALNEVRFSIRITNLPLSRMQTIALATLAGRPIRAYHIDAATIGATMLAAGFAVARQVLEVAISAGWTSPRTTFNLVSPSSRVFAAPR